MGSWASALHRCRACIAESSILKNIKTSINQNLEEWSLLVNDSPDISGIGLKKKNLLKAFQNVLAFFSDLGIKL